MKDLVKILKEVSGVEDFRVITQKTKTYECFFVHKNLETVRATDTEDASITVYKTLDGAVGESTFSVYASMSEDEIKQKIGVALTRASLVKNQPYSLPEGGVLDRSIPSNISAFDVSELAKRIADAVFKADAYENGSINALEIFIYEEETRVQNSKGVDKKQTSHRAAIEAIPTWTEDGQSVELYEMHHFTEFDESAVTAEIDKRMQEVRDRQHAVQPQTPQEINVVFSTREIFSLVSELIGQFDYSTVYSHSNLHKKGDSLQENATGDLLTVQLKAEIKGNRFSAVFDQDGVTLQDVTILEKGVVKNYYGSNRFGQYLGEKPTGVLRCLSVAGGTLTDEEINAAPYFEVVSLSGLQVDLYNDYVGGEVRLAYLFDGEKKVPVTGVSMSARLSEVLKDVRFSSEVVVDGHEGPKKALLKHVTIV